MNKPIKSVATVKTFPYGQHEMRLETGAIARQADGAVIASMGDTVVMVTVVGRREKSHLDFFPLTVEVEERTYAAGKIPGGFLSARGVHRRTRYLPVDSSIARSGRCSRKVT